MILLNVFYLNKNFRNFLNHLNGFNTKLVDCKLLTRKLIKLNFTHESFPTAWRFNEFETSDNMFTNWSLIIIFMKSETNKIFSLTARQFDNAHVQAFAPYRPREKIMQILIEPEINEVSIFF